MGKKSEDTERVERVLERVFLIIPNYNIPNILVWKSLKKCKGWGVWVFEEKNSKFMGKVFGNCYKQFLEQ